jgi:kynurenine formamidase
MKRMTFWGMIATCAIVLTIVAGPVMAEEKTDLWKMYDTIKTKKFVDLTHAWDANIPHWKGFDPARAETLFYYEPNVGTKGYGFFVTLYTHVGQWGTHVDPPNHFIKGLRSLDQIPPQEMFLPLVVIDCHEQVANDNDYQISMKDIQDWEAKYGQVPEGAFVAMRSDWSKRWPSQEKMQNVDKNGVAHYPGWSQEVLTYLYEKIKITASGHETTDTDRGLSTTKDDYGLEAYLLKQDKYQIELLANLDQVPAAGALVVATWPKPKNGSGFPARVFAILP